MSEAVIITIMVNGEKIKVLNPKINLVKKPGVHISLSLTGLVPPEEQGIATKIVSESDIKILFADSETLLFQGAVVDSYISMETSTTNPLMELSLQALSYTYLLDKEKKNRSFQNSAESYQAAVEVLLKEYPKAGVIMGPETDGKLLNRLAVQYYETDWEFFVRLASWLHQPLIAHSKGESPKLYFGAVWTSNRYTLSESEIDEVEEIHTAAGKGRLELNAFVWLTRRTDQNILDVGDVIEYRRIDFYVKEAEIKIENHAILHKYTFCTKEGFQVPETPNPYITGLSLPGAVKGVKGNQVQVNLDIDVLKDNDRWYAYSTFYSMFYCMPEKGDRVYLYFPQAQEASAFVLNSVRENAQAEDAGGGKEAIGSGELMPEEEPAENSAAPGQESGEETKDITPYIDAFAAPAGGKLIDLRVGFNDGTNFSLGDLAAAGRTEQTAGNSAGQSGSGSAVTPKQNLSFASLAGNDKIKVLSTPDGKMIILNDLDGSVSIHLDASTYVTLKGSQITIRAAGAVTLWSDQSINLNAKKSVVMEADEMIKISCKESNIELVPSELSVNANDIKLNP